MILVLSVGCTVLIIGICSHINLFSLFTVLVQICSVLMYMEWWDRMRSRAHRHSLTHSLAVGIQFLKLFWRENFARKRTKAANERTNARTHARTKGRMHGRTDERTNERANARTDGRTNERTNEHTNTTFFHNVEMLLYAECKRRS